MLPILAFEAPANMIDAYTPTPRILEAVFCRGSHWSRALSLELNAHRRDRQGQHTITTAAKLTKSQVQTFGILGTFVDLSK